MQQTDANIGVSKISQQRSGLNSVDMFSRDSPSFEYKSVSFSEGDQVQIRHWLHAGSVLAFSCNDRGVLLTRLLGLPPIPDLCRGVPHPSKTSPGMPNVPDFKVKSK